MTTSGATLLLVDDDAALRTAFTRALERRGYRVIETSGSSTVIDLIADHEPELVLLDNHMPEIGGVELIQMIRHQWSVDELPIVLISGSSIQGEIDQAMKAGATDFRRKPIDLSDLISIVTTTLEPVAPSEQSPQGTSP